MAMLIRDPRFSMSIPETENHRSQSRASYAKQLERRVVHIWKVVTRSTRRHQRVSVFARDFVFVNARRRSTLPARSSQLHFSA
ncbi:hypothetical protein BDQ12DRAFT_681339 [Crucibulum laeve]|uniref:Uncharacterized protein n=1 Tax=Crucibulum laeve TaxID=68775 RepID=A0A5C3M7L9_9AGAR|nr:hypothetical protein BDQ12DRAFT_681339 [Crucibulum laeve]